MNTHSPLIDRRKFLKQGAGWMAAMSLAGHSQQARAAEAPDPFDFSFYHIGDPQYRAFDESAKDGIKINVVNRENLKLMMQLKPETDMPVCGTIGKALGLINIGDCIEAGNDIDPATNQPLGLPATRLKQWDNYVSDFGLTGTEKGALINIPVYEGFGNRDQDNFVQGIIDRISQRNKHRPGLAATSGKYAYPTGAGGGFAGVTADGLHYAWRWGPVHFIHLNLRVGDSPLRYPCAGSHTFLADYLDKQVGFSGAPVILCMHISPVTKQEGEWPLEDRKKFYDLVVGYNVVAILCGNTTNFGIDQWRGPDDNGSLTIPVYRSDTFHRGGPTDGFMSVVRIQSLKEDPKRARMVIARRRRNQTWGESSTIEFSVTA